MIKKLLTSWKEEWIRKNEQKITLEYASRLETLETTLKKAEEDGERLLNSVRLKYDMEVSHHSELTKIIAAQNEDLSFQQKRLDDRKVELIQAQDELKTQIRLLEAKSHPSNFFIEAFSSGVNKSWDFLLPVMMENVEKLKAKMREDAAKEAIERLHAANKK